ncbi:MAG: DUF2694 family protein [Mycobacterium sp.]
MTEPDPEFDAVHPSGHLMFRSCRGGLLHGVVLSDAAMGVAADTLATAVLATAEVSHLKAVMEIRREIIGAGFTPSAELPTPADLAAAEEALRQSRIG